LPTLSGEKQGKGTTIARSGPTLDQSSAFERIDERQHAACGDSHGVMIMILSPTAMPSSPPHDRRLHLEPDAPSDGKGIAAPGVREENQQEGAGEVD
jgi:hypothetical protein